MALPSNPVEEFLRGETRPQLRDDGKHRRPFARLETAGQYVVALQPTALPQRHFCDCLK
jgi:hypothetical protein